MTIKEAEARTGLTRANIRYYEEQGFFSAARGENGYRDYSEENIDTLLKVKLLRQLNFSLEEIHALQNGSRELEPALAEREAGLERESRALEQAARLCQDIRADGASFRTLDAQRYLERLEREAAVLEQDRDPVRICAWRRLFARDLDFGLYTTLIVLTLQLAVRLNFLRASRWLLTLGALLLMTGGETLMLHFWGATPGKALLGLKVLREDGSRLSLEEAGRRTVYVMVFYGFAQMLLISGVLLFSIGGIAMLIWALWRTKHEKPMFWEQNQLYLEGSTRERTFWENRRNYLRAGGYLAAIAVCAGLTAGGHWLAAMPPHRGMELTVEQFVDNYNQAMAFAYGAENLSRKLTVSGAFEEIPRDSNDYVLYIFGKSPVPEESFRFTEENGILTQVTLTRAYSGSIPAERGRSYSVDIPYEQITLAARCFLWRRLGHSGAAELYQELVNQGGNLCWERDGFVVSSQARFSGYSPYGGELLIAQEGQIQSYFVECSMRRTG